MQLSAKGGTMSGDVILQGLPFASANLSDINYPAQLAIFNNFTGLTSYGFVFNVSPNTTTATAYHYTSNGLAGILGTANITNTTQIRGQIIYEAAS